MSAFIRYVPFILGGGGGGGITTIGLIDSQTPSSNGAVIVGSILYMQSASLTVPGLVNNTAQSFSGNKTFSGTVIANIVRTHEIEDFTAVLAIDVDNRQLTDNVGDPQLTWSTIGLNVPSLTASQLVATDASKNLVSQATGNLTDVGTDGIVVTGGTGAVVGTGTSIAQHVADSTHNGYLSSTDWSTFNAKQPAGSYITALTGDVTAAGPGSAAATLATVNSNVGSFTNASITVNAKGLVTAASNGTAPVTSLTVATANGFAGSFTATTTPVLTLTTTVTGVLIGNGTSISAQAVTNLTDAGTDGITVTNGTGAVLGASPVTLSQHVADTTHNGYLSSTDWNTFNGKQAAGNYITALTGDATASGPGSAALTLATVNGNVGSFGDSSHIPNFTVNAKGLITAAGSTASTATPTASIFAGWDANKNLSANNLIEGYTTTATAAGTTTLTVGSTYQQYFTGSTTQIVALPVTSTLVLGMQFNIVNLSSGSVTVNSSGGNLVATVVANSAAIVTVILTSGTTAASWSSVSSSGASGSAVAPTVQKFTSGTAQTYTTPTNPAPLYIRVRMVGGGGGGAGSGVSGVGSGGTGGNTLFGTTLLVANGGGGGSASTINGGVGGTASLGTGPIGTAIQGGIGGPGLGALTTQAGIGGGGAVSPFGGAGAGPNGGSNGLAAVANSGSGGGGGGCGSTSSDFSGAGGGAGGFVDAIITSPLSTYTYTVGAAGTAGTAGTSGTAGGAGGSGYIEVVEYYAGNSTGGTPVSNQTANTVYAGPASGGAAAPTFRALVNADVAPVSSLDLATGVAIHGTNTNNSASAGYVGEYIESLISVLTNFPTSGQFGDAASISLTAGDWDVIVMLDTSIGTTSWTFGPQIGISTTTGNSGTGLVFGVNAVSALVPTVSGDSCPVVPCYRVSISSTTTYYFKVRADYAATTPQYKGRLSARRIR